MRGQTKNQLIAVIIIAIVGVLATWYLTLPRQQYSKLSTLTGISYQPPPALTALTFTFSQPIVAGDVTGTSAALKGFRIAPAEAPDSPHSQLVAALLKGGGVPFTPVQTSPTTIVSNSVPAALAALGLPAMSFAGTGDMWFALPPPAAR